MKERINPEDEKFLRDSSLAFFGRITASVSHELNNVISIIDQTSGLLSDLLMSGVDISPERLQSIAEKINKQTIRGIGIIKRLNTFAHSVDDPLREFDANELVQNMMDLCRRFAGLNRAELDVHLSENPAVVSNNPFLVRQALFRCFQELLSAVDNGDRIEVTVKPLDNGAVLTIEGPALEKDAVDKFLEQLKPVTSCIKGEIRATDIDGRTRFELVIGKTTRAGK